MSVEAVLLDLDDTLYSQRTWLAQVWRRVAHEGARYGADIAEFRGALETVAAQGSDRGRIIDRALEQIRAVDVPVAPLVEAFLSFRSVALDPYPHVLEALVALRRRVRTAIVTDGDPEVQRSKIRALGVGELVDAIVISDEFGRDRRKPDPYALVVAAARLNVDPEACVYIGDRPDKDVVAAHRAGMRAVRVRAGEYRHAPEIPRPWMSVDDVAAAVRALTPWLPKAV